MIRLFLDNRTAVLLLLPFLIGLYVVGDILGVEHHISTRTDGLFFTSSSVNNFWSYFGQSFLILLNAVLLNAVFNSYEFLDKNTYVISLIYVVLTPMFVPLNQFSPVLIAHFFFIASLGMLFQLKQNSDGKITIFNAGILISIAIIFLPYLLILIPVILMMIVIIRSFSWREFFICLTGIGVPFIYYFSYLFLSDQFHFHWNLPKWQMHNYQDTLQHYPVVAIYVALLFISLLSLSARMLKSSLRLKKQIQMLGLVFTILFLLGAVDFYFSGSLFYFSLAIIPLTYFLTYAFLSKRSGIPANIFFYIALLYSFVKFFLNFTQD
ncbi:MAG: hypothetical protein RIS20_271 [Bacteroidota bacterium]|jgi:hypothetical protein